MNHDHAAGTDEFGSCGGDDQFLTVVCGPSDIDELCFSLETFDFGISDGGPLHGVVDVRAQILDNFSSLEQVNEDSLRHGAVIGGVSEIFLLKITGEAHSRCSLPHRLRVFLNCFLTQLEEFGPIIRLHLPTSIFLNSEFDVDAISVDTPRKEDLFPKQPLATCNDINHAVLSHSSDMPCSAGVGRRGVYDEKFPFTGGVEAVSRIVDFSVCVMRFLNALLEVD